MSNPPRMSDFFPGLRLEEDRRKREQEQKQMKDRIRKEYEELLPKKQEEDRLRREREEKEREIGNWEKLEMERKSRETLGSLGDLTGFRLGDSQSSRPAQRATLLKVGESMSAYETKWSSDGRFHLTLQRDQNLVLYSKDMIPIWASDTWRKGAVKARLREDGNFVLEDSSGQMVWESKTAGKGDKSSILTIDDTGKAIIKSDDKIIWESPVEMQGWKSKA